MINKIMQDFALLAKNEIYFDNACQTLRPKQVVDAMNEYYNEYPACGGRSMHHLASKVTKKCEEARSIIAKFINTKRKEEIIFTRNTTEGINLIAHSLKFKEGDIIITSDKEHNSNLIPWQVLVEKNGIEHKIIYSKVDNTFDLDEYKKLLNNKVRLVSLGFTSNLDGVTIPAKQIIELAHKAGALVLLDCAQAVPHQKIDVQELDVDFLAFSGHKMLGPSGIGVLYGKYKLLEELAPFMVGGDTVSESTYTTHKFLPPPEKFEAGLQDYAGIIGLGEAVNYINNVGFKFIKEQELLLNKFITEELQNIPNLTIIGPSDPSLRSGIVSFYIPNKDSHQIALMLDETAKIMVRSGQHCVHSWFNYKNIVGSARASFYFYNTMEEAEVFVKELKKVVSIL